MAGPDTVSGPAMILCRSELVAAARIGAGAAR
jgi:hypothetical protein